MHTIQFHAILYHTMSIQHAPDTRCGCRLAAAAASTHIITADSLASQPTAQSSEARAGAGGTQDTRAGTNPLVFEAAAARRGSAWTPASDGLLRQLAHNTWPHDMAHPEPGDWGPLKGRVPG